MMTKSKLRKVFLAGQTALSETERREMSERIKENFFARFSLEKVRRLHLFLSIREKGEIDTSPILKTVWQDFPNVRTFVPRVDFKNDVLEHLEYHPATKLKVSDWGINEPVGDELIEEKTFDLILVPLLAFDERGYRVGHGKGFYDKFLSLCRPDTLKVGLSFFGPVEEIEDINEFDIPLDFCVTPEKTYGFK